jgi:uncharacterized protein
MNLPFQDAPAKLKLIGLLLIALGSLFISTFIAFLLIEPFFGISYTEIGTLLSDSSDQHAINAAKFVQLISAIGIFIIPPIIFVFLAYKDRLGFLKLNKSGPFLIYLIIPALMIAAIPLINYLAELNKGLHLPEWLSGVEQWMKNQEEAAEKATKVFLAADDVLGLIYNLLLIAIIPAFGEELLFRGTIQNLFSEGKWNKHLAIWVAAIIFSALHFQFYGFFPRMLMGALFGYLMVWSGSLWAPIFAHFVNNGFAVTVSYLIEHKKVSPGIEKIGEGDGQQLQVISSFLIVTLLLLFFYKVSKEHKNLEEV